MEDQIKRVTKLIVLLQMSVLGLYLFQLGMIVGYLLVPVCTLWSLYEWGHLVYLE